jgi:hypothetical protein
VAGWRKLLELYRWAALRCSLLMAAFVVNMCEQLPFVRSQNICEFQDI